MTHGSLFSGIGGFDLAAEWMGWENIFHCEWNPFCQTILNYYWPNAASYSDIKQTDFTIYRGRIDVLAGGFPCQPFSMAGKRKGTDDDRYLWPEMLRAIREIQPKWIVGENVLGIVNWDGGLVFEQVCTQLEDQGYEVQPYILPAASVDAPHERYRVWFVAYRSNTGLENLQQQRENRIFESESTTNPKSESSRRKLQQRPGQRESGRCDSEGNATQASSKGLQRRARQRSPEQERESFRQLTKSPGKFWEEFPTQSPICNGDDGISTYLDGITFPKWRNESIKGGGNAVVPQIPFEIFKAIEKYELQHTEKEN